MNKSLDMVTGNPMQLLLRFTFPMMVGNLLHQVYSITDSIVVGRCLGQTALAAVGCTMPVVLLLASLMIGINMGVGIVMSQQFGRRDEAAMRNAFANSMYLGLFVSVLLALFGGVLAEPILRWMGTPQAPLRDAAAYLRINFITAVCPLFYYLFSSAFRGMGDSVTALYCLIASVVINISLDILFVAVLQWGVEGSAWATALAQGLSAIFSAVLLSRKYPAMRLHKEDFLFDVKMFGSIVRLTIPIALQSALNNLTNLVAQSAINTFGETAMAAYTAANRIGSLALMPMESVGTSLSVYTAQNYGANKPDRVRAGLRAALRLVMAIGAVLGLLLLFCGRMFAVLFLSQPAPELMDIVQNFLLITAVPGFISGIMLVYQQVLRGIGLPNQALAGSMVQLAVKIGVVAFGAWWCRSLNVIWAAWPISYILGTIVPYLYCRRRFAEKTE